MKRAPRLIGLTMLGLAALVAAPASTTTLLHFDVEQLTAIATVVAVGDVVGVDARWNDTHLGQLTIKMIGGQVGQEVAKLPGTPELATGERVLVFLEPRDDGDGYLIVGLFQGLFRLRNGAQGDELLYQELPPESVTVIENSSSPATRMLTLKDVRAIVRGGVR
jgi:hypothetical protein